VKPQIEFFVFGGSMKKVALLGAALGLSAVITGCGLLPTFSSPDPLALKDRETTAITLAKNNLVTQASTGTLTLSAKLQDSSDLNNLPAVPSSFAIALDMSSVIFNTACVAAVQTTNFTVSNISVVVSDDGAPSKTVTMTATPLTFKGTLTATGYSVSDVAGGKISADAAKLIEIIKNPGTGINSIEMNMNLSADSDTLKGCSVKLKLGAAKGDISF
jgi:hypothetical protein